MKRLVVLISGRGSNMRALLEAGLPARVAGVVSDRPGVAGLAIAAKFGVPTSVVDYRSAASRSAFDAALADEIDRHAPDLVILAGFMRVLGEAFVAHFAGRLINIHPSLLPLFPGLHTHRRALEAGVRIHGCTVHFVTPHVDSGPIIIQAAVPVLESDDEDSLAARVLVEEHRIYPQAVRWFLEGRLSLDGQGRVRLAGDPGTAAPLVWPALNTPVRPGG
jgi:phosphoribosylglycinamide formyltransferase-1